MNIKNNISIFKPFDFKNQFIEFAPHLDTLRSSVNDFFIHSLSDHSIKLRLPFPPHRKTVNDFLLVTKGYSTRQFGIKTFEIQQNELMCVPQLQVSTTDFFSEDLEGYYCHFSDEFLADTHLLLQWQPSDVDNSKLHLNSGVMDRIRDLLKIMNQLYQDNWTQNKIVLAQYLRTVITEIISSEAKRNIHLPKKKDLAIEYVKLVNLHLKEGFRLTDYAQLLHISPNHLNKIVKAKYGKSAQNIHNEIVLQEAKVLLLQTSKDISEIAFDLGFMDASYFGKFFKRLTSQTPLQYRKMIENY